MPQQSNFCQSENYLLFFPTLIFGSQILGVMWPAATRVLSRSKRENPGNKVGCARANQASRNLKKFFGWKQPDKSTLFTHFLVGWNLENLNTHPVSIVFFFVWGGLLQFSNENYRLFQTGTFLASENVGTMLWLFETMSQQYCNSVLR